MRLSIRIYTSSKRVCGAHVRRLGSMGSRIGELATILMATESNDALASTQKNFNENKSAPVQTLVADNQLQRNEDCNLDVTLTDAGSADTVTDPSADPSGLNYPDQVHTDINSDTDVTEGSRLMQPDSDPTEIIIKKEKLCGKKCCTVCCLIGWFISIILAILSLSGIIGGMEAYFNHHIEHYNNFTCTGVYLILQKFDCNEKSCIQFSDIDVEGVQANNGGDTAYVFLTECSSIDYSHDQSEDCRMDCGLSYDGLKITSFTVSNNTQECTLCTLPKNTHTQPRCNQTCHFYVSSKLVDSASSAGSGLCVLGKGVSNGAGECQRTQVSLKIDFRYTNQHRDIMRGVCISMIAIGFLATVTILIISVCCYRNKAKRSIEVESDPTVTEEGYTYQYNQTNSCSNHNLS